MMVRSVTLTAFLVKLPAPPTRGTSLATPVLTRMGPLAPAAASWICAAVMVVVVGNPVSVTAKSTVAAVIVFALSRVMFSLIVTLPDAPASIPVTGGTSLAGVSAMVNVGTLLDGLVGESSHAATIVKRLSATTKERRFISG